MRESTQNKYPELLTDLVDKGIDLLKSLGFDNQTAEKTAFAFVELIRREWAGQNLYVPKGQAYELSIRDEELYRRFDGANLFRLCKEYGITIQRGYQIIATIREKEFQRRQIQLPGLD